MSSLLRARSRSPLSTALRTVLSFAGAAGLVMGFVARAAIAEPGPAAPGVHFADGRMDSGWIDFEYFNGNRIFLPITVNGHRTVALLDSGATSTTVDRKLAASTGIKSDGSVSGQGIGGKDMMASARHVTIVAGRMTVGDAHVFVTDDSAIETSIGHALPMILGGEVFHDTIVDIDFARHRLAFRSPSAFEPPANARALPLTTVGEIRIVPMTVEGRSARMQFDLGNGGATLLYPAYWKPAGFPGDHRTSTTVSGGMGGYHVQTVMMLRAVGLGSTMFKDVPTTLLGDYTGTDTEKFDGNVGIELLGRFHLIVDFPHDRLFLAPQVDASEPFQVNHTGLVLQREGDDMTIRYVAPGSPAAAAGLTSNVRIVGVEDWSTRAPIALTGSWTTLPSGRKIRLHLSGGRDVVLTTARYY